MLTVACVWVKANVPYGVEYVANLHAMVRRHLSQPFRFVCLTDRPSAVPAGVEPIAIPSPAPLSGWWAKVRLHDPSLQLGDRVLYLDLDTLVVAALDPIVEFPAAFALAPHAGTFNGKGARGVVKRFNSSVMVWDHGASARVYTEWTLETTLRLWGDQDLIGELYPQASTFPATWVPRLSELLGSKPGPDARVVLCKVPKNAIAARVYPWVADIWRAA